MTQIKNLPNSFEAWMVNTENYEDICKEFFAEALTKDTVVNIYRNAIRPWFGKNITCELLDWKVFSSKSNLEMIKINALVIELHNDRYNAAPHPLNLNEDWVISAVAIRDKFEHDLNKGTIFKAEYEAKTHESFLNEIINLKLDTYTTVDLSFAKTLEYHAGKAIQTEAATHFESDLEKILMDQFIQFNETAQQHLEEKRASLDKKYDDLSDDEKEWFQIIQKMERYRSIEEETSLKEKQVNKHPWKPEDAVDLLQNLFYHNSLDQLVYSSYVIELFLRTIQTDTLAIFTGPSGTGKSSIVQAMADAINGAKAHMIAVQSSWTELDDLLGYFNPIDKSFIASPFLDALIEAHHDPENLHLICLDEMNLAHVEYYFSEFLSIREQEDPVIHLYNKRFFDQAKHIVKEAKEEDVFTDKYPLSHQKLTNMIEQNNHIIRFW